MKKIHLGLMAVISLLLIGSLAYGGLTLYVNQKQLPEGVVLSGWEVGGKPAGEVLSELDRRLESLELMAVEFKGAKLPEGIEALSLRQAGVKYRADGFREAVAKLSEGELWERAVYRYRFAQEWDLMVDWNREALRRHFTPEWEKERFGEPVNAVRSIENDIVRYQPEQSVFRIDWTALEMLFSAALPGDFSPLESGREEKLALELPLTALQPEVTVESLKAEGIERKIVQISTSLGASGPGRVHNVKAAADAVDGMVLKPGEEFNYAKVVERAQKKHGFREAPVIIGGKLVPGVGGGICQVSSTVYNAVLLTGLEVTERRNHSLPVNYLPKGLDASFAEGAINFRFKNNTGKHLLIRSEVNGRTLTLKFFGTFPENTVYELETKLIESVPAPLKYVRDTSLHPGTHRILEKGKPGYIVETYRVKKVGGTVAERERISRDVYRGQSTVIGMNPTSGELPDGGSLPKPPVIEDGVSSTL